MDTEPKPQRGVSENATTAAGLLHPPKYPSTPHWPWSEKVHRDDTYHTSPEFFLNRPVVITEKLDGGNTCLWNGQVYARSVDMPANDGWFAMVKKHHAWKSLQFGPEYVFNGEDLYGVHSIEYDPMHEDETFYLFAARLFAGERFRFLGWRDVQVYAKELNVPHVPERFVGEFKTVEEITAWFHRERPKPSVLGRECEGFVLRTLEGCWSEDFPQHVCKYVRANHVQTDQHWRKNWRPAKLKVR